MMEYNDRSLGVSLILCPFSWIIIVDFLLGSMICLATASWADHGGTRCGFHFVEWTVKPSRKWLVTPITCVSLCSSHHVLLGTSYYYGLQDLCLGKRDGCFSSGSIRSTFQH